MAHTHGGVKAKPGSARAGIGVWSVDIRQNLETCQPVESFNRK